MKLYALFESTKGKYDVCPETRAYRDNGGSIKNILCVSPQLETLKCLTEQLNGEKMLVVAIKELKLVANSTNKKNYPKKQNYCLFCKELKTNIARHFELCHSDEKKVKKFLVLRKGSAERYEIISNLRKMGNYEYNKTHEKKPILSRRTYKLKEPVNPKKNYLPCPKCKAFYSKKTLSRHYTYCCKEATQKGASRSVLRDARWLVNTDSIHPVACLQLKTKILPAMKRDGVFDTLKSDVLILMLGNYLIPKYREHQEYMIRQKLRFVTKYFLKVKELCADVVCFQNLFTPKYFDIALQAVQEIGEMNKVTSTYSKPTSAMAMIHYLKICCRILEGYYIREGKDSEEKAAKRFFKLLITEAPGKINKPAHYDFNENKRKQKVIKKRLIPQTSDVNKFKSYLLKHLAKSYQSLMEQGFNYSTWKKLAELTLLYISVYNKKRAGEAQRILASDFENMQCLRDDALPELIDDLNELDRREIDCTYKLLIRGKLHRTVSVLIPQKIKIYLTYIYDNRSNAKVPDENPYLFGIPGMLSGKRYKTLETCTLLRKYTLFANLQNPSSIRTTLLRKHFATKTSTLNLKDTQKDTVVNFMGHERRIHDEYYRQQTVSGDLLMKKILDDRKVSGMENDIDITEPAVEGINTLEQETNCDPVLSQASMSEDPTVDAVVPMENFNTLEFDTQDYPIVMDCENIANEEECGAEIRTINNESVSVQENTTANLSPRHSQVQKYSQTSEHQIDNYNMEFQCIQASTSSTTRTRIKENTLAINYKESPDDKDEPYSGGSSDEWEPTTETMSCKEYSEDELTSIKVTKMRQTKDTAKRRIAWATPEKHLVRNLFQNHIEKIRVPTLNECREAVNKSEELQHRTATQVQRWIAHHIKNKYFTCNSNRIRRSWTTPEKKVVRNAFAHYINGGQYPPGPEIEEMIRTNPVLKHRTIPGVKSFIQHERQKLFTISLSD